jgi:Rrf2 family protein
VRVSSKVDYAVRAAVELATAEPGVNVKAEAIASAQDIPRKFLDNILQGLRQAGIIESRRGPDGGHRLARPASEIAIADVIRAIDGPLANVGGRSPDELALAGSAAPLKEVWVAVRASLREVLEEVTLEDVASGELPDHVHELTGLPGAWERR